MVLLPEDQILRFFASARDDISSYDQMKKDGYVKVKVKEPFIAFKKQIENPEEYAFPTLSEKIEIFCEHIAEMANPKLPPIPKYLTHKEHYDSPKANEYPLQLITPHNKRRTHSTLHDMPWLEEVEPHSVWINSLDAKRRSINNGDMVDVFNDRGRIRIPAKVTERIIPGAVCVYQGAWFNPNEDGIDISGCANVLVNDNYSPGGAFPSNSALVEIELTKKNSSGIKS
jgi:anaerobic dimethyl sulfoxide reductase subunit A